MGRVRTVLGDIDSTDLGMVYAHEHLIISGGLGVMKKSDLLLNSVEAACREVEDVKRYNIKTFVDMMPLDCGRHPEHLVEISRQTNTHVIAATGFHKPMYYDDIHWIYKYTEEQIRDLLVAEVTEGMDRHSYNGPIIERIPARAGLLKGASDYNRISAVSKKLFVSVAEAQKMTGAPISTHTEEGTMGLEQIQFMTDLGVSPESIIICHTDRNPDLEYHLSMLQTGAFLEYDNASRIKYWPDSMIIDLIVKVVEAGYEDQILLGTDFALRSYWKAYGGGPGMAHLAASFIPRLKQNGLSEETIAKFMVHNPARAFSFQDIG
ncbi:phosphotriesterase [Paenibacillus solisilvae]|uniref:Phosphotriesterase n=1 Tax=Paenibacillus solisilvae TaxID=2486751 RepID=A0ABW0WBC8_9BACL